METKNQLNKVLSKCRKPLKNNTKSIKTNIPKDKLFLALLKDEKLPVPVQEFKFHHTRNWRFDFCYPDKKLAIEVEGGVYTGGAHGSISGILRDMEKYTQGAVLGYRILRILPQNLLKKETLNIIKEALKNE